MRHPPAALRLATAFLILVVMMLNPMAASGQAQAATVRNDAIVDVTQTPWGSPQPYGCLNASYQAQASPPQWECPLSSTGLPLADAAVTASDVDAVQVNVDWKDVEPCRGKEVWGPLDAEIAAIVDAGKHVILTVRFQSGGGIGPDVGQPWQIHATSTSHGSSTIRISGSPPKDPAAQPYPAGSCAVNLPGPLLMGTTLDVENSAGAPARDTTLTKVGKLSHGVRTITVSPPVDVSKPAGLLVPTCRSYSVVGNKTTGGFNGLSTDYLPAWVIQDLDPTGSANDPNALCDTSTGVYMPNYWSAVFQKDWLGFVQAVAAHFHSLGTGFPESDPLHATSYVPSDIDYVRVGLGLSDEGLPYLRQSSLAAQYAAWSTDMNTKAACPALTSGSWTERWESWQECMLSIYRSDFTWTGSVSPALVYPINVDSAGAKIASMTSNSSCQIGGVTESCSVIRLGANSTPPPASVPVQSVPARSGEFAPLPVVAIGSGFAMGADANDHGGYTTGSSLASVSTLGAVTTLTITPALPYTDYLELTWPDVTIPGVSATASNWATSALTVGEWAIKQGMGISQNGFSPGWALNWHGYSYLQGSKTRVKSGNYFPEEPSSLDAQTLLSLRGWLAGNDLTPPVFALQTVSTMTQQCSATGAARNEGNLCIPYGELQPTAYPECGRWKVQWTAWLAQSNWSYNPRDTGLPGYFATSLEVYSTDLDDEMAVDQRVNKQDGLQPLQTTYGQWSSNRSAPTTPPNEAKWTTICPS